MTSVGDFLEGMFAGDLGGCCRDLGGDFNVTRVDQKVGRLGWLDP